MTPDERSFARHFPHRIKWIDRLQCDKTGMPISTNDFVYKNIEYELKTPQKYRYVVISRQIRGAVKAHSQKQNFMVYLRRPLSQKLLLKLQNYNLNNPDNQIEELLVFDRIKITKIELTKN